MTTQNLPGSDAARHGTGDADLSIMYAAHDAFRRDLVSLARAAGADLSDPARQQSVAAGWEVFKRQLLLHHTAEDRFIWPALRTRFAHSENALSVLDAMEAEHGQIDPLLAAVDDAFSRRRADGMATGDDWPGVDRLADVVDVLVSTLTGHLTHEERDGLPLIGEGFSSAQWRGVGRQIAKSNGMSNGSEMFAWMLSGVPADQVKNAIGQLPPPVRVLYRALWRPRYAKTSRW